MLSVFGSVSPRVAVCTESSEILTCQRGLARIKACCFITPFLTPHPGVKPGRPRYYTKKETYASVFLPFSVGPAIDCEIGRARGEEREKWEKWALKF